MLSFRPILAALLAFSLIACASAPPSYGPAKDDQSKGYRTIKLEEDRYRVTWRGGSTDLARDNALRRAAEITLRQGYQWFEIVGQDTERTSGQRRPSTGISIGGSTGGNTRVGVGIGIPIGGGRTSGDSFVSIEIIMGTGDKPAGRDAYDARSVLDNLG